jgi:hypothetical protein
VKKQNVIPYKKPENLMELFQQVSARPSMYVGASRFDLGAAYIDGFYHALGDLRPESNNPMELIEFGYWLSAKFRQPRNIMWSDILMRAFPHEDETIFEKLASLFEEFLQNKEKVEDDSGSQ